MGKTTTRAFSLTNETSQELDEIVEKLKGKGEDFQREFILPLGYSPISNVSQFSEIAIREFIKHTRKGIIEGEK